MARLIIEILGGIIIAGVCYSYGFTRGYKKCKESYLAIHKMGK
nr:MAG TPA: hypothetical protein [Caudoviricetes sp.]